MSCAAVGLICVSVLGTAPLPPFHFFPPPITPSLLPLPLLYLFQSACLTHFSFRSYFLLLHTRKNQEKKGLIMVTSKLVVRLSPPPTPTTPLPPYPLDSFCWTRTKTKSGKVDGFLCSALLLFVVVGPFGLLLLLLISLFIYIQIFCSLFFFHSLFFLFSTHFLCVVFFFFFIRAQFSVLRMRPTPSPSSFPLSFPPAIQLDST